MEKIYYVNQGVFSTSGNGDYSYSKEFDKYDDAINHFNKIKYDVNGWIFYRQSDVLATELVVVDEDENYETLEYQEVTR